MPRHDEPECLRQWREWCRNPPKVCHNCEHYGDDGRCSAFGGMVPPEDFAATPGSCDHWVHEIPF